jgi:nicotinamide riboside kinase
VRTGPPGQAGAAGALRIAIVGAESTGKTWLARELAAALATQTGLRVTWVPEWLRGWCERTGRTPQPHEQGAILRAHHEQIEAAAAGHDIVVCDTTALMTAVYSRLLFDDRSLDERAVALHRRMDATLLTALDLPWVADGHLRDGPQVQQPVDDLLRGLLLAHRLPHARVGGAGVARLQSALDAVRPLLAAPAIGEGETAPGRPGTPPRRGLFTGLHAPPAAAGGASARTWQCSCCDVPEYEQALLRQRTAGQERADGA